MSEVKFIPFTEFAPDKKLIGGESLHEARNVVPMFGQYRLVNKLSPLGSQSSSEPPTGSHSQILVEEVTVQYARPDDQLTGPGNSANSWEGSKPGVELHTLIDEQDPNDGDFIRGRSFITFSLSDVDDPSSNSDHILRYRFRIRNATASSAYEVKAELFESDFGALGLIATSASSGTTGANGDTDWIEESYTLTALEAASIIDYTQLFVKLSTVTLNGSEQKVRPIADILVGSWKTHTGSSTNLFSAIDEVSVNDSDYITSGVLAPGTQVISKFKLTKPIDPIATENLEEILRFRSRKSQEACQLNVEIFSGVTERVDDTDYSAVAVDTFEETEISDLFNGIDYTKDLFVEFTAKLPQNSTLTETTLISPTSSTNQLLSWTDGVDTTNVHEAVDEITPNDSDFITSLATNSEIHLHIPAFTDPLVDTGWKIKVRARFTSSAQTLTALLYRGNTLIDGDGIALTDSFQTYEVPIIVPSNKVLDSTALNIRLFADGAGIDVSYVALEYPTPATVDVSFLEYETIPLVRALFSWVEFQVPSTVTEFVGDKEQFFLGTKSALYKFDGQSFEDVSKAGGYGSGSFIPLAWDFAQWGNDVIATNYVDPVQKYSQGDTDFSDLINSTEKPKARFVNVISNHLILANINHTGHFPDEVWWSAIDDATDFDPDITTQSDSQRLLPTAGGITGLVGGAEFGYVFKQNSVYRMNYVGHPEIFSFHVIAREGTKYSKSIVSVDNDIYFFGNGGFRVIRGNEVIPIGNLKVVKFLIDSEYESNYILSPLVGQDSEIQNSIIGWYDKISRLIFWVYRGPEDSSNQLNHVIVYNPAEDRWGRIDEDLNISAGGSILNNSLEDNFIHRGAYIFTWDGTDIEFARFSDDITYESELETAVISLEPGNNVTLNFVRPVWSPHLKSGVLPNLVVTITAGNEPTLSEDTVSTEVDYNDANEDGWIPCDINGEFFKFTLEIPELTGQNSKEFSGLQIKLPKNYTMQDF